MRKPISRRLTLPALTALTFAGAFSAFLSMTSTPAMALCKYGTPHCANPTAGHQTYPSVGGVQLPPNGWHDPECGYYGNCGTTSTATITSGSNSNRAVSVGKTYAR
jgi:hypothetical protein